MVRFSAESACIGAANDALCSIRIVAQNGATGAITEMKPASGNNFAFDSSSFEDGFESHSMDRSLSLPAGSYIIRPQMAVAFGPASFWIDDYSLIIERAAQ